MIADVTPAAATPAATATVRLVILLDTPSPPITVRDRPKRLRLDNRAEARSRPAVLSTSAKPAWTASAVNQFEAGK
jgi:hypothetical protein